MVNVCFLSLLFFVTLVSIYQTKSQTVYGCNAPLNEPCGRHHLACGDGEVIAFEYEELNHPITLVEKSSTVQCPLANKDACTAHCCKNSTENTSIGFILPSGIPIQTTTPLEYDYYDDNDDDDGGVNMSDIVSIHNRCSNRQSCTITSPQATSSSDGFDFVKYNYICIQESRVYSILEKRKFRKRSVAYLYISGRGDNKLELGDRYTCTCQIQSAEEITLYSTYINLSKDSCRKIRISSSDKNLFNCSDDGIRIFYEILLYSKEPIFIDLTQLTLNPDDFLWVEVYASNEFIDVSCSGCGESVGEGVTNDSIRYLLNWICICFSLLALVYIDMI